MEVNDFQKMMMRACDTIEDNILESPSSNTKVNNTETKKESIVNKEPFNLEKTKEEMNLLGNRLNEVFKKISEIEVKIKKYKNYHRVSKVNGIIHPFLINGGNREAYYKDGLVYVLLGSNEETFNFMDLDKQNIDVFFKDEDKLVFTLRSSFFEVIKKEDFDKLKVLNDESQKLYEERQNLSSKISIIEKNISNYIFWQQYNIPFKFEVGIKPVLSGLSKNSWGDGSSRATVYHIILKENLQSNKLKRRVNDFLCSQPKGNFYSEPFITLNDEILMEVTCKQCLKQLEKYKIK